MTIPYTDFHRRRIFTRRYQLRDNTLHALAWIASRREGEANATAVAKEICVSTAAVTGIIDSLEKLGYVKRTQSKANRKINLLTATKEGKRVLGMIGIQADPKEGLHPAAQQPQS